MRIWTERIPVGRGVAVLGIDPDGPVNYGGTKEWGVYVSDKTLAENPSAIKEAREQVLRAMIDWRIANV